MEKKHPNCDHSEDFNETCEGLKAVLDEDDTPSHSQDGRGWEKEFEEIKKGRQNSKYHRNYIATHVVEDFIRTEKEKSRQEALEEVEAAMNKDAYYMEIGGVMVKVVSVDVALEALKKKAGITN